MELRLQSISIAQTNLLRSWYPCVRPQVVGIRDGTVNRGMELLLLKAFTNAAANAIELRARALGMRTRQDAAV